MAGRKNWRPALMRSEVECVTARCTLRALVTQLARQGVQCPLLRAAPVAAGRLFEVAKTASPGGYLCNRTQIEAFLFLSPLA